MNRKKIILLLFQFICLVSFGQKNDIVSLKLRIDTTEVEKKIIMTVSNRTVQKIKICNPMSLIYTGLYMYNISKNYEEPRTKIRPTFLDWVTIDSGKVLDVEFNIGGRKIDQLYNLKRGERYKFWITYSCTLELDSSTTIISTSHESVITSNKLEFTW